MKKTRLKKLIAGAMVLASIVAVNPTGAYAYQKASNITSSAAVTPESSFTFDATTGTITKYIGTDADVIIPSTIGGVAVQNIGLKSFADNKTIKSVTIPYGVTTIGGQAFIRSSITSIVIPNSVTTLSGGVFASSNIKSVVLPDSVTKIGGDVFYCCSNLENITFSKNIKDLPFTTAIQCYKLTNLVIPDGIESIQSDAFFNNTNLISVTVPNSVKFIDGGAFLQCDKATFYVSSAAVKQLLIKSGIDQSRIILK